MSGVYEQKPVKRTKISSDRVQVKLDVTGNGANDLQMIALYRDLGYEVKNEDRYQVVMEAPRELAEKNHQATIDQHRQRMKDRSAPEGVSLVSNTNESLVGVTPESLLGSSSEPEFELDA